MHGFYIPRMIEPELARALACSPAVAVLGPRQCGKSTMVGEFLSKRDGGHVSLDLQSRADLNKLSEPELFLERHRGGCWSSASCPRRPVPRGDSGN